MTIDPPFDLSLGAIRALRAIYAHYHTHDTFPGLSDLRRALLASDDPLDEQAAEDLDQLGGRFVRKDHDRAGPIRLTVTGMYAAVGACEELTDLVGLLQICQQRFKEKDSSRKVSVADVRSALGLDDSRDTRLQLLSERREFSNGPSGNDEEGWFWEVSDGIIQYRKVRSIEAFIQVCEAAHPDRLETPYTYLPSGIGFLERTRTDAREAHDAVGPAPAVPPGFTFIHHAGLRAIAERDHSDLAALLVSPGQFTAKVILAGAVVEAILLDDIVDDEHAIPERLLALPLGGLVAEARRTGAKVSDRVTKLADLAKDYRNLGHPGRELKEGRFIQEDVDVVAVLMNALIAERRSLRLVDPNETA